MDGHGDTFARERDALPRSFFERDAVAVARSLLNCLLIHDTDAGRIMGRISETEAYTSDDPASHSYRGKTERNAAMFGPAGHAYVYFTYGMHFCLNVVTGSEASGDAVLIRSVEPILGRELMSRRRGLAVEEIDRMSADDTAKTGVRWGRILCGGPGKLCQAFGITRSENDDDMTRDGNGRLWIAFPAAESVNPQAEITASPRVGIRQAAEIPWRFTIVGDPFVSRR